MRSVRLARAPGSGGAERSVAVVVPPVCAREDSASSTDARSSWAGPRACASSLSTASAAVRDAHCRAGRTARCPRATSRSRSQETNRIFTVPLTFSPFAGRCAAATRPLTRRGRVPGARRAARDAPGGSVGRGRDATTAMTTAPEGRAGQQAAIAALNRSAGRCQPSVLRGRSLISAATRVISWTVCISSVPFGK